MNNSYSTSDIYLASTLASLDYIIDNITQENGKFIFHILQPQDNPPPYLTSVEADNYWTHALLVDPNELFSQFKTLKARMYDLKRSGG